MMPWFSAHAIGRVERSLTEMVESVGLWGKNRRWFGRGSSRRLLVTHEEMSTSWISLSAFVSI